MSSTTDIIASGGADTGTGLPVPVLPVSITWFLCQYEHCNQAFNHREKLTIHTEKSHANNEDSNQCQSNPSIENIPDDGEEDLLSLPQTVVPSTNEENFHSVVNKKHDTDFLSKTTETETEIMAAVSEVEEEISEECISQIVNNKCDDTSVVIEAEVERCSSSENYSDHIISVVTCHPPTLELEVVESEPKTAIVVENTTITETASPGHGHGYGPGHGHGHGPGPGPVEIEAISTNRKLRTTVPVVKYQTRASLRLKRLLANDNEVQNATMTQSAAEYTPGNPGDFGGTLEVNVEAKDSNHSNCLDILAPTVLTRHQLNLALSALSDSSPPQPQQQQLQLLPRRLADTSRVSRTRKRTNQSKPRCKYEKKRQLARFRIRNRVQPTASFPALKRIKITKKLGPSCQSMTTPAVKAEAKALATSNSASSNDESYRKFKEELLTSCSLCDKDVPMSSFILHVKYCGSPNSANQYHSSNNEAEEPSYQASSPAGLDLKLKTPVPVAEIHSLPRRNRNKDCTKDNQNKAAITDSSCCNTHCINKKFQCDTCPRTFSTKTGLGLHKKAHFSQKYPRRSDTLQQHNISHSQVNRPFYQNPFQWKHQCPECGHRFWNKSHLQKHVAIKHGDISIKMDATVKREATLKEIINESTDADVTNTTSSWLPFKCNYCPKTFRTLNFLTMHKYSHAEYSAYGCSICNIGFRTSVREEIHSRLHTGERPFVCNIKNCPEKFISKGYMELHRRRIHGNNNMKSNTSRSKLQMMTTHRNFPCLLCPKKFVSKPSLKQHLMSHSDERKFKCPYEECTAAYKTSQTFIEHLRLHTDETPYTCDICGRKYARQGSFRVHQRSHTDY